MSDRNLENHGKDDRLLIDNQGLQRLIEDNADGMLALDSSGIIRFANPAAVRLLNRSREELVGESFGFPIGDDMASEIDLLSGDSGPMTVEMRVVGTTWEGLSAKVVSLRDISAKKRVERWERMAHDILALLNEPEHGKNLVCGIVQDIRKSLAMDAVGIRLREGEDFPYYDTIGFSESHLKPDCLSCAGAAVGDVPQGEDDEPCRNCMCRRVLEGQTEPGLPYFTLMGSFWTSSTTALLAGNSGEDSSWRICERCNAEGYESVALIPLCAGAQTMGLLQLNDHRRNRFSKEMIHTLEVLCASIGVALARRKTEMDLHASEDRFRSLFEFNDTLLRTFPFPMDIVDKDGRVLFMNQRLKGLVDETQMAGTCWTRFKDDGQQCHRCPLQREIVIGETRTMEVGGVLHGRTVEIFHTGMMYQGQPALLEIFIDVTEKKGLQTQLAQSDRLTTMGTLAAGVAHEINNPLAYVLYNIESLSVDLPKVAEVVRRCHSYMFTHLGPDAANAQLGAFAEFCTPAALEDINARFRDALSGSIRIKDIVRTLGTFSRVERTEVAPVNLHTAIEHAITMAFNEIRYRARLVKDFGTVPMVLASDGKIAQVFLNLLINAAHAIGEGHVEDNEIRVRTWAEEGGSVFAEVGDTGGGIPLELQAKLFEPFFTTKRIGVGTGLGLSICKNIVASFGGQITFTSTPGKGTRFLIRLPRIPENWETRREEVQARTVERPSVRGRILVVDDEEGLRKAFVRLLGRTHEVITAGSGEEAKALLENDRGFDVIFCDLMMSRMSGMELHAWLSETDPALAGQVVFVTGGAFTPGAGDYLRKVGNLRVDKPFDATAMLKMTEELVLAARAKLKV